MTEELLPCPFCGSGETRFDENNHWTGMKSVLTSVEIIHWCPSEHVINRRTIVVKGKTREQAIELWNRRKS